MLKNGVVNAFPGCFCVLAILIQILTGPAEPDLEYIAFHAEPNCTEFCTSAVPNMANDMDGEYLLGKARNHGFPRAPCNSPEGPEFPVVIAVFRPVSIGAFSKKLMQVRKTLSLDTRVLTSNTSFRSY